MNSFVVTRFCFPLAIVAWLVGNAITFAGVVDFEDLTPNVPYSSGGYFWNGSDESGGFTSGGVHFVNTYATDPQYGDYWNGWSYSNTADVTESEFTNQYSAYAGADHTDPGSNYGVYCEPWSATPTVTLAAGSRARGAWITNTTYAALSMLNGDSFAKKFGGVNGNEADWFLLSISGTDSTGATHTIPFYLADYRFADNSLDYIVDAWTWVDLSLLGDATELTFDLSSSDNIDIGGYSYMNTPAYFAIDDIEVVPEPGTFAILGTGGVLLAVGFLARRRLNRTNR